MEAQILNMYLAYTDDSGTGDKKAPFQVMTSVIMEDSDFHGTELMMSAVAYILMPDEREDNFEEFHASDLYWGHGVFEGIDQNKRFEAIESLLGLVKHNRWPVGYGAVNKNKLAPLVYGSANPVDMCLRVCMKGVDEWILGHSHIGSSRIGSYPLGLMIVDDYSDAKLKFQLRRSFRQFRQLYKPGCTLPESGLQLHDEMYFGSSRDSVGLQLADLCGLFISHHLQGRQESQRFYDLFKHQIIFSQVEPSER